MGRGRSSRLRERNDQLTVGGERERESLPSVLYLTLVQESIPS